MRDRKGALIRILSVPIYPHELADPTEAVADYLIDNDVLPVTRCEYCIHCTPVEGGLPLCTQHNIAVCYKDFCSYGERRGSDV